MIAKGPRVRQSLSLDVKDFKPKPKDVRIAFAFKYKASMHNYL